MAIIISSREAIARVIADEVVASLPPFLNLRFLFQVGLKKGDIYHRTRCYQCKHSNSISSGLLNLLNDENWTLESIPFPPRQMPERDHARSGSLG